MKRALLVSALAALAASCSSTGQDINDHWNARSNSPRVARFLLGYDAEKDGNYRDFAWERKQDINLFLRRYFLHHNPDNPNHVEWPGRYRERPVNSPLPNPVDFVHLEGVLLGFAASGGGGGFALLPLDSLIGVIGEDDGYEEFWGGIEDTTAATVGAATPGMINQILRSMGLGGTGKPAVITASYPALGLDEDRDGDFVSTVTFMGEDETEE